MYNTVLNAYTVVLKITYFSGSCALHSREGFADSRICSGKPRLL